MLAQAEKRRPLRPPDAVSLPRNLDVLVMHNEARLRHILDFHLERAGYRVRVAQDTLAAGSLVIEAAPDAMVLDLEMRGVNCFEFLAEIRRNRSIAFFPVVYLTSDRRVAACAYELNAACVLKPVQPERLLAAVAWQCSEFWNPEAAHHERAGDREKQHQRVQREPGDLHPAKPERLAKRALQRRHEQQRDQP